MADDPIEPRAKKPVTDEDLRSALAGPAPLANRTFLTKMPGGIRLSFMEENLGKVPATYRAAVFLQYPDALSLRDLMIRNLKDIEEMLEDASEEDMEPIKKPSIKDGA